MRRLPAWGLVVFLGLSATGCRQVPGSCSGQPNKLCIEVDLDHVSAVPNTLSVTATATGAGGTRTLQDDVMDSVAQAFAARQRYVFEIDLTPAADPDQVTVAVVARQDAQELARGKVAWQRGQALLVRLPISPATPDGGGIDLSPPADLTGGGPDGPAGPAWQSGMAAVATIGGGGVLSNPADVCWSGTRLYVSDQGHHRVAVFSGLDMNATIVAAVGRPDTVTPGTTPPATSGTTMNSPMGLWCDATQLMVADAGNHRVLYFASNPGTNAPASGIAGQMNGGAGMPNRGMATPDKNTLSGPSGVFVYGNRLFIADRGNNRVVGYVTNDFTSLAALSASILLGQGTNFTSTTPGSGAAGLDRPEGVLVVSGRLAVTDSLNDRVVVFDAPNGTGGTADAALGQPDINGTGAGFAATALSQPRTVRVLGNQTYVADRLNSRVLVYLQGLPATGTFNGAASAVLGEPDFVSPPVTPGSTMKDLAKPAGLFVTQVGAQMVLIVADSGNNRVQVFRTP